MNDKELLTIKEFAELSGRTPQAIYKQLNNKLSPFVKMVDNKKMLEKRALKEVFDIDIEQQKQQQLNEKTNFESPLYRILKEELDAKNEQILNLQVELISERQHSREQADKLAVFADQAQKLQLAQMKPQITEEEEKPVKKGFLKRLFGI